MSDITQEVPVIEANKCDDPAECRRTADALAEVGCFALRLKDGVKDNTVPLTAMLVEYFRQPDAIKDRDVRKDLFFQVGRTPPFQETARPRPERLAELQPIHHPTPFKGPDPKERFMAAVGARKPSKKFHELAAAPVIPDGFPQWKELTDAWADQALDVMCTISRMAATGFGLDPEAFNDLTDGGPHLFAPTGSDLSKHGRPGTALAAWHDDINFVSIHGKSNFPGLRVWKRDGTAIWVKVPDGCLLVQAGQQFEHLTGGAVLAGLHEVVANEAMADKILLDLAVGDVPWRVSTTLFGHVVSDETLRPLGRFATPQAIAKYPPILAGTHVLNELRLLGLAV